RPEILRKKPGEPPAEFVSREDFLHQCCLHERRRKKLVERRFVSHGSVSIAAVPSAGSFANRLGKRSVALRACVIESENAGEGCIAVSASTDRVGRARGEACEPRCEVTRERCSRIAPALGSEAQQLRMKLEQPSPSVWTLERASRRAFEVR